MCLLWSHTAPDTENHKNDKTIILEIFPKLLSWQTILKWSMQNLFQAEEIITLTYWSFKTTYVHSMPLYSEVSENNHDPHGPQIPSIFHSYEVF